MQCIQGALAGSSCQRFGLHKRYTKTAQRQSVPRDSKESAMTFLSAAIQYQAPQQDTTPMPDPRSPEEVLHLLAQEPPQGEYSVDAF
jgi:hypothetical protein